VSGNDDRVGIFLSLYSSYQSRIYGYIMSAIVDWNQADDILQETMSVLWNKFDQYVIGTDFLSWALKVAHFQVLCHIKKQKIQNKYFSRQTIENISEIAVSLSTDTEEPLKALRKCVKKLPERSQHLLALRYEDNTTIQKIARRLQQSVHTLYKEYQKIHYQLFQCIRRQLEWNRAER